MIGKKRPDRPAPPKRDQEQIPGDYRGQHQRQMNETIEQRLAPEIPACEQEGKGKPERERHSGGDDGDLERQPDRDPFIGRKIKHATNACMPRRPAQDPARWLGETASPEAPFRGRGRAYGAPATAKVILAGGASASNRGLTATVAKAETAPQIAPLSMG